MKTITPEMQKIIDERVTAIEDAHASSLIEGLDMGQELFDAKIKRALEPVNNDVFVERELKITKLRILRCHKVMTL